VALDQPGKYKVEVKASGYKSFNKNVVIEDLNNPEVILDIPLERTGEVINPVKKMWFYYMPELLNAIRALILLFMISGFVYSIYIFVNYPILLNLIILIVYFALFMMNMFIEYSKRKNVEGRVVEIDTHAGLSGASLVLFNEKGQQADIQLTNRNGIVKLRAKPGSYKVQAYKNGYMMNELEGKERSLNLMVDKRGYLSKAIFMKKT
jgi:hypothetical protein